MHELIFFCTLNAKYKNSERFGLDLKPKHRDSKISPAKKIKSIHLQYKRLALK